VVLAAESAPQGNTVLTTRFFEECWQRRVLFCTSTSKDDGYIDRRLFRPQPITLRDIEYLISSLAQVDRNWIQLVKQGAPLRAGAYCNADGSASLPRVYAAYETGHTIQLSKMHKRWPSIGRLCRAVETACLDADVPLAMRIGSHLYLTPPHSTGLEPHYDNHDVVVLQVEGTKRWKIYGALQDFPVEMQVGSVARTALPALEHDLLLEPGDILYVPRGQYHEASTAEQYSVHITLDLTACTWADLFTRVMQCQPRLRESLPVGAFSDGGARLRESCEQRATALGQAADELPSVAEVLFRHFLSDLDLLPGSGLEQLDGVSAVGLDTRLRRRAGTLSMVLKDASQPSFFFPGAGVRGTRVLASWLCELDELRPFTVRDLPDDLAPDGKVAAASELLRRGFLELASSTE
jgi:hypothetical protein